MVTTFVCTSTSTDSTPATSETSSLIAAPQWAQWIFGTLYVTVSVITRSIPKGGTQEKGLRKRETAPRAVGDPPRDLVNPAVDGDEPAPASSGEVDLHQAVGPRTRRVGAHLDVDPGGP